MCSQSTGVTSQRFNHTHPNWISQTFILGLTRVTLLSCSSKCSNQNWGYIFFSAFNACLSVKVIVIGLAYLYSAVETYWITINLLLHSRTVIQCDTCIALSNMATVYPPALLVEMTGIKPVTHTYLGFTMLTFHREHPQIIQLDSYPLADPHACEAYC